MMTTAQVKCFKRKNLTPMASEDSARDEWMHNAAAAHFQDGLPFWKHSQIHPEVYCKGCQMFLNPVKLTVNTSCQWVRVSKAAVSAQFPGDTEF